MGRTRLYCLSIIPMLMMVLIHSTVLSDTITNRNILIDRAYNLIARKTVANMTLEDKIGQMFVVDASNYNNSPTGGVILFQNDLQNLDQVLELTDNMQKTTNIPLFIGIDQEGGIVNRLSMGTTMSGNMALGATGSSDFAYATGRVIGKELSSLGINLNFAPVLDVNNNPLNPIIGIRSFGSDSKLVGELGIEYINGLKNSNVIAVAKHFPGHGDTNMDSHLGLPQISHDINRLWAIELKPFQRAINRGVEMIMTAHVTFPTIDSTTVKSKKDGQDITIPATLSRKVLTELLRKEMGFNGVIITDAFNMKAISDHFHEEEAVLMAIKAGADIILMPINMEKAFARVLREIKEGNLLEERIDESVVKIIELKLKYGIIQSSYRPLSTTSLDKVRQIVGSEDHKETQEIMVDSSTTVVVNEQKSLPFKISDGDKILLIMPSIRTRDNYVSAISKVLNKKQDNVKIDSLIYSHSSHINQEQQRKISNANYVIVGTNNLSINDFRYKYINRIINYANNENTPLVIISLGNPYDIMYLENTKAYVATYGDFEANIKSSIKTILGENNPKGKLPVEIPNREGTDILFKLGHGLKYD